MIYVGYPCIGKTSISGQDNFIDLESSNFDHREGWEEEYVRVAYDLSLQGYNVFLSSHKKVREALNKNCIPFICVYPNFSMYDIWFDRTAKRYKKYPSEKNLRALERITTHFKEDIMALGNEKSKYVIRQGNGKKEPDGSWSFDLKYFLQHPNTYVDEIPPGVMVVECNEKPKGDDSYLDELLDE